MCKILRVLVLAGLFCRWQAKAKVRALGGENAQIAAGIALSLPLSPAFCNLLSATIHLILSIRRYSRQRVSLILNVGDHKLNSFEEQFFVKLRAE